jgi:hypothetical protein
MPASENEVALYLVYLPVGIPALAGGMRKISK